MSSLKNYKNVIKKRKTKRKSVAPDSSQLSTQRVRSNQNNKLAINISLGPLKFNGIKNGMDIMSFAPYKDKINKQSPQLIQDIIDEFNEYNIDIVNWDMQSQAYFIAKALDDGVLKIVRNGKRISGNQFLHLVKNNQLSTNQIEAIVDKADLLHSKILASLIL